MPNAYTLKQADPDDAGSIADVHVETWQDAYRTSMPDDVLDALSVEDREQQWRSQLKDGEVEVWLAVGDNDRIFGFTAFGPAREEDSNGGELYALYVRPERQRNWIGHSLLGTAETRMQQRGHSEAYLWVLTDNTGARTFYEQCGWSADESETGKRIDERCDMTLEEVRYRRKLNESALR